MIDEELVPWGIINFEIHRKYTLPSLLSKCLTNQIGFHERPFYFRYGRTKRESDSTEHRVIASYRLHRRFRGYSVRRRLYQRDYPTERPPCETLKMVLAERNSENVRNGRRSRGDRKSVV